MKGIEEKGQQLNIRIHDPKRYVKFGTQVLSERNGENAFERIGGYNSRTHKWENQAFRINLSAYPNYTGVKKDINEIRNLPEAKKKAALGIAKTYFGHGVNR